MEIRMPQLGESVTEGTIGRWLVQPGEAVRRYQPLAEVITDKVNAELPAPADGTILTLEVPEGATVPVGTLIATMAAAGELGGGPAGTAGGTDAPGAVATSAAGPGVSGAAVQGPTSAAGRLPDGAAGQGLGGSAGQELTSVAGRAPSGAARQGLGSAVGQAVLNSAVDQALSNARTGQPPTSGASVRAQPASSAGVPISTPAHANTSPSGQVLANPLPHRPPSHNGDAEADAGTARGRYSPAVLRLAQEHGLDLSQIRGTGLGGRITRKDVEAAIQTKRAAAQTEASAVPTSSSPIQADRPAAQATPTAVAKSSPETSASPMPDAVSPRAGFPVATGTYASMQGPSQAALPAPSPGDQVIPVDPVRRRIAEKMVLSRREAPHAWSMVPVDVTDLVKLRTREAEEFRRREGVPLSYVAFFIKAVAESLKEHPILNSQWAGDQIILKREINISVAVATETALAVPVIKGADRLSIAGLCHAIADVAARARAGKLTLEDVTGGTFTVNNTGAFGSILSQPIINYPQAAILSFEAITKTPVVLENDAIAIRSIMNICLSIDHRILDGLAAGRFLQAVRARLESMGPGRTSLY